MESWIEEYMKLLAKHEGTEGAPAVEGGGYTRGYGITELTESFLSTLKTKGANADEMSDKDLAKEYVIWNANNIKAKYDNYDSWPDSVKMAAVDLQYNGGDVSRFKNFDKALREGRWQDAMSETLDVVGANDPKTKKRGALRGLGNRRFDIYNVVANDVGFEPIESLSVIQDGDSSIFSYSLKDGSTIDKSISVPIHSASGAYDSVKKKTSIDPSIPLPEEGSFSIFEDPKKGVGIVTPEEDITLTEDYQRAKQLGLQEAMISGEEGGLGSAPTAIDEPDLIPPEQGFLPIEEFDNIEPTISATDSFAVPNDFFPDAELANKAIQLNKLNEPQIENFATPTPQKIKEDPNFLQNNRKMRYGDVMRSRLGDDQYDYEMYTPNMGEVAMAAFRQYNILPSLARLGTNLFMGSEPEEGYSAFADRELKSIVGEEGLFFFRHSMSHGQSMEKLRRMEIDMADADLLQKSRSGAGLGIASAMVDPTLALPFMGAQGITRLDRFRKGFAANYLATGGGQAIIETQNESRDAQVAFLGVLGASFLGGALAVGLGKGYTPAMLAEHRLGQDSFRTNVLLQPSRYTPEQLAEMKQIASAGAAVSPELARTNAYRMLEAEGMAETGFGIEKLGWNPTLRLFKSLNPISREIVPELVDVGGLMQRKVQQGEAMKQSVETTFRTTYYPSVLEAVRVSDTAYLKYRNRAVPDGEIRRSVEMMKVKAADIFKRQDGTLTEVEFRNRIGYAMRRGDVDNYGDAASEYVTQAAQGFRKVFNKVKDEAQSVRLFQKEMAKDLSRARNAGDLARVAKLEEDIQRLREHGVTTNTALSYLPRIYRVDKIEQNVPRFLGIVSRHLMSTNRGMSKGQANIIASQILDSVTRRKPFIDYESATDALDWIKAPSGAQARSLSIPDEVLEEFLESDVEALMRTHVKTMGMDIELTRKFGDSSLEDVIGQVEREYQKLISETSDFNKRSRLAEGMQNDLRDIRGLRDRLRGTYGASKDPHQLSSRFVRVMKSFNVLTGMGSAVVSSIPDLVRVAMVEGFLNAYSRGFATYFDESARIVRTMSKPELEKAAIGVDAALGLRAHAMSDMGDLFGNRYTIERSLNDATGMFFFMNGLNIWNQVLKEMAGNVTMLRMTESIMASGGWESLSRIQREKLLKNGIGRTDYDIMRMNITNHGEQVRGEWLPNTDGWTDATQRLKFRNALNQNVERIIITPGAGDRALWTSTEFGSLLTQFKSYGQGAMQRMLTAGLQEKDAAFWQGAFLIVGLAGIVNEIKRAQYGMTSNESFDQKLINAIDRSGLLGWFTDVNNGIEKLSDYKLGMRPFLTDQPSFPVHSTAKAGAVFGPTASTSMNSLGVFSDMISGNVTQDTAQDLRFIFPTGNLFYLDPIYDGVFGEGGQSSNVNRQQ